MPLDFAQSSRSTIGIEWELQLIDKDSNDLRQAAAHILNECGDHPFIHGEMLLNTVEITSGVHANVAGCVEDLSEGVGILRSYTEPLRIDVATAGSHPFADPAYQRVTEAERYAELVNRTQYWGRQMLLYGTHVHVGIEDRRKVLPILRALLTRAFHLQALSSSSPYWASRKTGYASNRAMVFQQLPTSGTPRQFDTWDDLEHYHDDMLKTGVIDNFNEVRWDIRPSPKWGTLEVRVCDANTNLQELRAVSSLIHCLVEYFSTQLDQGRDLPTIPDWFVAENKWRAARYGMESILITDANAEEELVTDTVRAMVADLEPVAERLGCSEELELVLDIVDNGAAYQRFQAVAAQHNGSLDAVVEHMRAEMRADKPLGPDAIDSADAAHEERQR